MLTKAQIEAYFESRLSGQNLRWSPRNTPARCPHHNDREASLSIHGETGKWKCFAGCGQGNLIDFEVMVSGRDREDCRAELAKEFGIEPLQVPDAIYSYTDAWGKFVFEKIRFKTQNSKRFLLRTKVDGKWVWNLDSIKNKPLYNLRNIVSSRYVLVCEGEKDCDRVNSLLAQSERAEVTATTNFEGAGPGKWKDEYSRHFAGKQVVILPDNDPPGIERAEEIAKSLSGWAYAVKIVMLPGLSEHGDVSDYLETHSLDELFECISRVPFWHPSVDMTPRVFVTASQFLEKTQADSIDWLVEGAIQGGGNGFIIAHPKSGKSWMALDLALSLAGKVPFLGMDVPQQRRVALLSREDASGLTAWRMKHLLQRKGILSDLDNLLVNTRHQMPYFRIESDECMRTVCKELADFGPDLIILDVFNVIHDAEENDNTGMRKVMNRLSELQERTKSAICVAHHYSKNGGSGSLISKCRGASSIMGWAEWVMGIEILNPNEPQREWVRRTNFETKACSPHDPIDWMIDSCGDGVKLRTLSATPVIQEKPVEKTLFQ